MRGARNGGHLKSPLNIGEARERIEESYEKSYKHWKKSYEHWKKSYEHWTKSPMSIGQKSLQIIGVRSGPVPALFFRARSRD